MAVRTVERAVVPVLDAGYRTCVIGASGSVVAVTAQTVGRAVKRERRFQNWRIVEHCSRAVVTVVAAGCACIRAVVLDARVGWVKEHGCELACAVVAVGTVCRAACLQVEACPVLAVVIEAACSSCDVYAVACEAARIGIVVIDKHGGDVLVAVYAGIQVACRTASCRDVAAALVVVCYKPRTVCSGFFSA